jgi:DNA-binding LacI/PurR family transcriptional regulator
MTRPQAHRPSVRPLRHATARDVAKASGVSVMTVSRVFNGRPNVDEKTRTKVLKAARRLGYRPNQIAQSLALSRTRTIGVVVPEISHSFFPEAIRGIEEVTYKAGYHLLLMHSAEAADRERDALHTLESKRVDGILLSVAQDADDVQAYRRVLDVGIPLVFFDRCVRGIGATCVGIDDQESARSITRHLLDHGYKRIALLAGPRHLAISRDRAAGYRRAHVDAERAYEAALMVEAGFHEDAGYAAMMSLLQLPAALRPRAVVAINDPAAYGAMRAISDEGLNVPDDIAVVGFSDDLRASLMPVPLTTIRQPAYELGRLAAERVVATINGTQGSRKQFIVRGEMVVRRSCGCTPQVGPGERKEKS